MINDQEQFDVMIIGGGAAGISAAVWCHDLGLSAILFNSAERLGGQMLHVHNPVMNYPGLHAANGSEITTEFLKNLKGRESVILKHSAEVEFIDPKQMTVISGGEQFRSRTMIFATGVRRRSAGIAGEKEFAGRGILRSGALEFEKITNKTTVVVGGGDAAVENALILSKTAKKVYLIHRRSEFTARREFVETVKDTPNIEVITDTTVEELKGSGKLESLIIKNVLNGALQTISIDHIIFRLGVIPNTELLAGKLSLDPSGYIKADAFCQTDLPGFFAAGDVANPVSPTIATAVGMGAAAAKSAYRFIFENAS